MADDERKRYWNEEYARYWQSRVEEANRSSQDSQLIEKDSAAPSDELYKDLIRELEIPSNSRVLEIGCGFGRTIPILFAITSHVDAVDISEAMIAKARVSCGHLNGVNFCVSEAEKLPFSADRFDRVICFGVFDALYQREALIEMNRVLLPKGRALITGKNDNYFANDEKALVAEENARAKGHPNYFTDVSTLLGTVNTFGFRVVAQRFYLRRGDTAKNQFTTDTPSNFYEYALIFEKISTPTDRARMLEISAPISKTFGNRESNS
jgi:ubiquinone/menaquinone biosynthesis C-methylase UbiE